MRRVAYFELVENPRNPKQPEVKRAGWGYFHQFGTDFEEFDNGPGQFSTAIIETPTGKILNWPVQLVQFLDKPISGKD